MIGTFVGPYLVLRKLGAGGMGEVFLAEDGRLRRRVALKQLTAGAVHGPEGRARVLHEARAVARLQHPGIATVFDVVEHDGSVVIVMEYVEGETLAARLAAGRIDAAQAVALAAQIADALADAHANGVLHCDLKPANVHLTQAGRPKILDFGLAQLTSAARASEDTRLVTSDAGLRGVSGSPGYMAPERLTGAVPDERGDIYALGVIAFEMLTGRRPFSGGDLVSLAATALTTEPPSPTTIDASIPANVSAVVLKALARDPTARFQSAGEFASALRDPALLPAAAATPSPAVRSGFASGKYGTRAAVGLAILAMGAMAMTVAGRWPWSTSAGQPAPAVAPAVVVTPFANLSQDASNDPLGVGITDDLTTKLAALPNVAVVSRNTTAAYLARFPKSATLARDLGASFVIDGGFERVGEQLRVRVTLRSAEGQTVWTRDYESPLPRLFELQRALAEDLATGLNLSLSDVERSALAADSTRSVEALADYSQGRQFLDRSDVQGNVDHAIDLFEQALARDASFALAQAGLGSAYWQKFNQTKDAAWTARAIAASLEALRLNPNLAEVHVALATVYDGLGQTPAAVDALGKALALQSNNDDAHRVLGDILARQGRTDDAVREYQRAIAIRPNYWLNHNRLAVTMMKVGRYPEAAAAFRRVTELQPDSAVGFNNLGVVAMMQDDTALALASFTRAAEITPRASSFSNIGTVHFWNGRFDDARQAYERALALSTSDPSLHRNLGDALTGLGDRAGAERAYRQALVVANNQLKVNPKDAASLGLVAVVEAKLGRKADARAHADRAIALAATDASVLYRSAVVAALANDGDRAMADLTAAVAAGYSLNQVKHDLDLRTLRDRPDFVALLNKRTP
jgi:tetratricopeptide (TPR) repeat protein